jgi:DNA gyrase subunit B
VPEEEPHRVEVTGADDDGLEVRIIEKTTGAALAATIPLALFHSPGYRSLKATHARLVEITGPPPFQVRMGKLSEAVHTFEALRPVILEMAKEGLNLQRFKGLGEMNPIQLWETTMNPENRVLKKVSVDDAAAADAMFTMLMGDRVEPRRDFIERNARDVKFLDI